MADKIGNGPRVSDLIRKFEEKSSDAEDKPANKEGSPKSTDVIEEGLVARRIAELEKKPTAAKPQNLVKDDFEEMSHLPDGFVKDAVARFESAGTRSKKNVSSDNTLTGGLRMPDAEDRSPLRPPVAGDGLGWAPNSPTSSPPILPHSENPGLPVTGAVDITPALDPTMAGFSYRITKLPSDLKAGKVEFQIETGGKRYNLAGGGPMSEADMQRIAENSARACFLLQKTGVETFESATLRREGSLHLENPSLEEAGTMSQVVAKLGVPEEFANSLTTLDLLPNGEIDCAAGEQRYHKSAADNVLTERDFVAADGALSNLGDALVAFAKAAFEKPSVRKVPWPSAKAVVDSEKKPPRDAPDTNLNPDAGTSDSDAPIVLAGDAGGVQPVPVTTNSVDPASSPAKPVNTDVTIRPDGPAVVSGGDTKTLSPGRTIHDVFDFAEKKARKKRERPGYIASILRGTDYQPVFAKGDNWFKKGASAVGNWLGKVLQKVGSDLIHKKIEGGPSIPISDAEGRKVSLGFAVSGQKIRERDLRDGDPRLIAIEKMRSEYPGGLPVWIEGKLGQKFGVDLGHSIPIGGSGAMVNFGFAANESLEFGMQRLVYFESPSMDAFSRADDQAKRLTKMPLKAENFSAMEEGAKFFIKGSANLRLDAALGLGVTVPALDNVPPLNKLVKVGASVEAGAFVSMAGSFDMSVTNRGDGKARLVLGNDKSVEAGIHLKAFAGVQIEQEALVNILRGFVDYVADGGDPASFENQLPNDEERELASSMSGYLRLLNKNLAEGVGSNAMNRLVTQYGSAAFTARKGIKLKQDFDTNIDFNFTSKHMVTLPRADMVPEALRNGRGDGQTLKIEAGKISSVAYNMAVRGDLRLVQQLALVRASGVRVNEKVTTKEKTLSDAIELRLPFVEFVRKTATGSKTIDSYTPEQGRTKTAIESFDYEYKSLFGDIEVSGHDLRVHTPKGKSQEALFFGSDENFSADFVVENLTEKWTNFEEMQNYMGILDALSEGQLVDRCREALAQGEFRDIPADDIGVIDRMFNLRKEYGRTTAHLHVWLGEKGLRSLLADDTSEDDLYMAIGEIFTNLGSGSKETLPDWALPGAERGLERNGERLSVSGGPAANYDFHSGERSLKSARYLVDNIKLLRDEMSAAKTPEQEQAVAEDIRDFLADCKDRLSAYSALAMLVPQDQRAVEMRLTSLREDETPIRFTYIQDGRSSELLYATGFAKMAMAQFKRFGSTLDSETRIRVGNLLGKVRSQLNSPSPDLFVLDRSMRALREELNILDESSHELIDVIESDIGLARSYMDSIPQVETIEAILPGALGTQLSILRMTTQRELNKANPDAALLREKFKNIFEKMPIYRHVQAAESIIESTANLANELAATEPELAQAAVTAVNQFRSAMEASKLDEPAIRKAIENMTAVNRTLAGELEDEVQANGEIAAIEIVAAAKRDSGNLASDATVDRELSAAREAEAIRFKSLAGKASTAAVSYFERTGAVPKTFIGTGRTALGEGIVTASMVREAELAMANSRPTGQLGIPALPDSKILDMIDLLRKGDASEFVAMADALRFRQPVPYDQPRVMVLDSLLASIPVGERAGFLEKVPSARKGMFERVFRDIDADLSNGGTRTSAEKLDEVLLATPSYKQDMAFLGALRSKDPAKFSAALDSLGYNGAFQKLQGKSTSRLEDVFSRLTGEDLNLVCSQIDKTERSRFLDLIRSSDLRPQTRAQLAGQIVDNNFFWKQEEDLVEALVTGMNAGDLRLFFDQLYTDGKLERFLNAGSWWQTILEVFTFGLARLWTHDNKAALAVVTRQGWSSQELQAQYNTHVPFTERLEKDAENIFLESTLATVPMDPVVASGCRAVHSIVGNVKYYHYREIPKAGLKMLEKTAEGAGEALVNRLVDVAKNGGSPKEIAKEYEKFFQGLAPEAVAYQFGTGDTDGTAVVLSRALRDGAIKKLNSEAGSGRNKFITPELITFLNDATQVGVMQDPPPADADS